MPTLQGQFAIFRAKTIRGENAILVVPEPKSEPITYVSWQDAYEVSFETVEGGEGKPDEYVTIVGSDGSKIHFGPDPGGYKQ